MRTSASSPITNLHLGNQRGDPDKLMKQMNSSSNPNCWNEIKETCEKVASECFPMSFYMGLDVLVTPDFKKHYILEVNAFGDLLPRILIDDMDTYTMQVFELKKMFNIKS